MTQIALGDEHNSYKGGQDQMFHTKVKPFNVLHPNSFFASQPEALQLDSLSIVAAPGFTSARVLVLAGDCEALRDGKFANACSALPSSLLPHPRLLC